MIQYWRVRCKKKQAEFEKFSPEYGDSSAEMTVFIAKLFDYRTIGLTMDDGRWTIFNHKKTRITRNFLNPEVFLSVVLRSLKERWGFQG